jgi:hypothetical protein
VFKTIHANQAVRSARAIGLTHFRRSRIVHPFRLPIFTTSPRIEASSYVSYTICAPSTTLGAAVFIENSDIVYDMDRRTAIFWDDVRHAFKAFLAAHPRGSRDPWTQASLADALGMHPATLANFLSGTNLQVSGFAVAKACSLGMEFECDDFRVGRVRTEGPSPAPRLTEQLVLEFSDEFNIARKTDPLTIELRKKPNGSMVRDIIRLRVVSD